jgi:translocator protein
MRTAVMGALRRQSQALSPLATALAVAAPLLIGAVGGVVTAGSVPTWYRALEKPAWNPPDAVFGPVWTALYLSMGVALALVLRSGWTPLRRGAVILFAVQLGLNLAWTLVFFGLHAIGPALVTIVLLWASIAATLVAFERVNAVAFGLMVPYLAWVTFASVLNGAVWLLNG